MDKMKDWFRGSKALAVRRFLKSVDAAIEPAEEMRNDLIKRYGETDGDQIVIRPGTVQARRFIEEYSEVAREMVELDDIGVTVDDAEIEASEWTARDIDMLEWLGIYR
jgi:hypothetical protein